MNRHGLRSIFNSIASAEPPSEDKRVRLALVASCRAMNLVCIPGYDLVQKAHLALMREVLLKPFSVFHGQTSICRGLFG